MSEKWARIEILPSNLGYSKYFYWALTHRNETIIFSKDSYPSKARAKRAALRAKRLMAEAEIEEGK
jgi:uncharacterized protein YegP (UPF0339 family)